MRLPVPPLVALLGIAIAMLASLAWFGSRSALASPATDSQRPELAYLKQVNQWQPPSDPQLLFLLMGQFVNSGRQTEGIAFIESLLKRFGSELNDRQRADYLSALGGLRAARANDVVLFRRIGWVRETLEILDDAKALTGGEAFVQRWMSGVVRAQVPSILGERENALADLSWCEAHADKAPNPGWLRDVYFYRAVLLRADGQNEEARRYLALSGYPEETQVAQFTTPFSEDPVAGHMFSERRIHEIVPSSVFVVSGFEFTEYYFVVSKDGRELIAIDAGSRADSAKAATEALRARHPHLPPLTTIFVTHAHWDHVGGQKYFRNLIPSPRFVGRETYGEELVHDASVNPTGLRVFFGRNFNLEDVLTYKPDVVIERSTEMVVGGTRFNLIPTRGGETNDAMLIHIPDQGVLFVGDIMMPYLGAPFANEGSLDGMIGSVDQINHLHPRYLLHGHEPLTRIFASTEMLNQLRPNLVWLQSEVLQAIREGAERTAIQAKNLIPPTLERTGSDVHLAYLLIRENAINRLVSQNSGYWQNGLRGLDILTDADHGEALADYLGVSDVQLAAAAERLVVDGKHEMAANLLRWGEARFPGSTKLASVREGAYVRLMDKYQQFNPFKFILYSAQIHRPTIQVESPKAAP